MRTHGQSKNVVYKTLYEVCSAINCHQGLSLVKNADEVKSRSCYGIKEYCVGAVDGLAIQIKAPTLRESFKLFGYENVSKLIILRYVRYELQTRRCNLRYIGINE